MNAHHPRLRSGFTLIELLIVMVVLGVLFVIGLFLFNDVRSSSQNTKAKSTTRAAFVKALSGYTENGNSYGATDAAAQAQLQGMSSEGLSYVIASGDHDQPNEVYVQIEDGANDLPSTGTFMGSPSQQITLCGLSETGRIYCMRANQEVSLAATAQESVFSTLVNASGSVRAHGDTLPDAVCALVQPGAAANVSSCGSGNTGWGTEGGGTALPETDVLVWGHGSHGELGNNSTVSSVAPVLNNSALLEGKTITHITAGIYHVCVIASGKAYCWGGNTSGQVGNNSTADALQPVVVDSSATYGDAVVTDISAGYYHTCAAAGGRAYCWGNGNNNRLGSGTATQSSVPVAVNTSSALGTKEVTAVNAGQYHSCAVADGGAYCWGYNGYGNLGNNSTTDAPLAVAVNTTLIGSTGVSDISAGTMHTCALANGAAYCWGWGMDGQLGRNSTSQSTVPVAVDTSTGIGASAVTALGKGDYHTCVVAGGVPYCWGRGGSGQLGNNSTTNALAPVATIATAFGGDPVTSINGDTNHTCAVAGGAVYCWGANSSGHLGTNNTTQSLVPIASYTGGDLGGKTVVGVAAGNGHTAVIANP